MKSFLASLFLLSLAASYVPAQSPGFDPDRLNRIHAVIEDAIQKKEIPGAVALIQHKGKTVLHRSYGFSDIESHKKMDVNSIFRIASMTKAITLAGVMVLYERGHFQLNDPVAKYIPEFANPRILVAADSAGNVLETIPSKKPIRIIDLMTHTSGISYPFQANKLQAVYKKHGLIDAITSRDIVLADQMKILAGLPLLFEPGSKYQYGLSIDVLGYLCEVISGKNLQQFLEDELFRPLKMHDTGFYLPDSKKDRLVTLYSWTPGVPLVKSTGNESPIKIDNPRFPVEGAKRYYSGGGGLTSTAHDYGRFVQMLLNKGQLEGAKILSRKSVELLFAPRTDRNSDGRPDAGLIGLAYIAEPGRLGELSTAGLSQGGGAFYGHFWIDPAEELTIVFLSQVLPPGTNISARFQTMVYQALN